LIHDDLPSIDNDDMRRGKPTCHKKFGEAIAILAGDALFAEAFHLISKEQKASAQVLQDIMRELSEAIGVWGMVGGQVADVIISREEANLEALYFIHSHKTGKLIVSAAKMGARLAEVTFEQLAAIEKYAFHLGMAFQITDDILDEVGDSSLMGKNIGSDRKQKKATYPAVFGLEKAQKEATQSAEAAIESLKDIKSENLERLARFVVQRSS
ncbi:MAG: polyprenyl synthetase family protein, partial [Actinobacteria bacterium]